METRTLTRDLLITALIVLVLRLATFYTPVMDVDEAFFSLFSSVMNGGGIPYVDVMDNKPPLIFLVYSTMWKLFGRDNMLAMRILTCAVIILTSLTIRGIGAKFASEGAARSAMFIYAAATTFMEPKALAANINIFMMLPASLAFLSFVSATKRDAWWKWALCGALTGACFFLRYQGGIIGVVIAFCALIDSLSPGKVIKRALFSILGGLAFTALIFAYLARVGALDAYILSFKMGLIYSEQAGTFAFWPRFLSKGGLFIAGVLPLIALAAVLAVKLTGSRAWTKGAGYILIWFLLSWVSVCYGRRFFSHYFIQLLPSLALLAGWGFSLLTTGAARKTFIAAISFWALFFFVIHFEELNVRPHTGIHASDWVEISELECPVGEYIRSGTKEGDKIFVWGYAPPVYICAGRFPAARFLWLDILAGRVSGGKRFRTGDAGAGSPNEIRNSLWKDLTSDLEKNTPAYIVDTSSSEFGGYKDFPLENFPIYEWMKKKGYELEATVQGAELYRMKQL